MFEQVIWATDGSPSADAALPFARALAEASAGKLIAVHIVEYTLPGKGGEHSAPVHLKEDELDRKIEDQLAELVQAGIEVKLVQGTASLGGAAVEIATAARNEGAGAIVVGTRGHTVLSGLLVGSVAMRLLHLAPCPVLVVPPPQEG